jgi:hypothetical protein
MKCECCGKEGCDKEQDFCYGCGHIICVDCAEGIGGEHSLATHKEAYQKGESQKLEVEKCKNRRMKTG